MSLAPYTGSRRLMRALYTLLCLLLLAFKATAAATNYAANRASLLDPAKLATLGPRSANPRVQKAVDWLALARQQGQKPEAILDRVLAGKMSADAAKLTNAALLRNLDITEELGCPDAEGLAEIRKGTAPTIRAAPTRETSFRWTTSSRGRSHRSSITSSPTWS